MKNQRGITLIALVITIIVLLILAGVSISLLVGDNGVLNKSTKAVKATKKAVAEEQVGLAWTSAKAKYYDDSIYDESIKDENYFKASELTNYLSQGEIVDVKYKMNSNGDSLVVYKDTTGKQPVYYTVTIKGSGQVIVDDNSTTTLPDIPSVPSADNPELAKADKAYKNSLDVIEMVRTAEGAIAEIHSVLQRMNELSVQASNGTNTDVDRAAINNEVQDLIAEIDRVSNTVQYKEVNLLDGTISGNNGWIAELEERNLKISIDKINSETLGIKNVNTLSEESSLVAIDKVKEAINYIDNMRSKLGGRVNQFEHIVNYYYEEVEILSEGLSDAEIKDKLALSGITEILDILNRVNELADQVIDAVGYDNSDKQHKVDEGLLLKEAINIIAEDANYKGERLLNGTYKDIPNLNCVGLGTGGAELYVGYMTEAEVARTKTECQNAIATVQAIANKLN